MSEGRGRVTFVTGPPGSGKTTTGTEWALHRKRPTWWLEWDSVANSLLALGELGCDCVPQGASERYHQAAEVIAIQARHIIEAGVDCVIIGAWSPEPPVPGWETWESVAALDPLVVVLLPDVEVAVARNRRRTEQGKSGVPEDWVRSSYSQGWGTWSSRSNAVIIDNSRLTVDEAVRALEEAAGAH